MNQKTKLTLSIGVNIALFVIVVTIIFGIFGTTAFDFVLFKKTLVSLCEISKKDGIKLQSVDANNVTTDLCAH